MSEYEKMLEDGRKPSYNDKDVYKKDDTQDLLVHKEDPNFVKPVGGGDWKRYDKDEHDK
ncbi:hypothetical protein GCM10027347_59190 [Larkinella harenae]